MPRSEALHLALQTRVPGVRRLRRYVSSGGLCRHAAHSTAIQDGAVGAGQRAETLRVHPDLECARHSCAQPARAPPPPRGRAPYKAAPPSACQRAGQAEGRACALERKLAPLHSLAKERNFFTELGLILLA